MFGPWLLPLGAIFVIYHRRGYFVRGDCQCSARPSYQTGKRYNSQASDLLLASCFSMHIFLSNRQAIKSLSLTACPFVISPNGDQQTGGHANTHRFLQEQVSEFIHKGPKTKGNRKPLASRSRAPETKASRVNQLFLTQLMKYYLRIRFSLVKSAYIIWFVVVVDVVSPSSLHNGLALGGEKSVETQMTKTL